MYGKAKLRLAQKIYSKTFFLIAKTIGRKIKMLDTVGKTLGVKNNWKGKVCA